LLDIPHSNNGSNPINHDLMPKFFVDWSLIMLKMETKEKRRKKKGKKEKRKKLKRKAIKKGKKEKE
jgi:hypothetical protein